MQITLKQTELESALKHYISTQGFNLTGKSITIDFTAGRGTSGHSATIDIEDAPVVASSIPSGVTGVAQMARDSAVNKIVAQAAGAAAEEAKDPPFDTEDRPLGGLPAADAHEGGKTTSLFA